MAAGLATSGDGLGWSSTTPVVSSETLAAAFLPRAGAPSPAGFLRVAVASPSAAFGLGARLGLASGGSSRPRPSFTRSSLATAARSGLMARMPL